MDDEVEVVRRLFAAVEHRDLPQLLACYADDVEIHEAQVLPYGGIWRGRKGAAAHAAGFLNAWGALQGTAEIPLDAQFWGNGSGTVCVLFRHRATNHANGTRFDAPEVSIYQVRDQQVVRSQMFHADSAAVAQFLRAAAGHDADADALS